MNNNWSKQNTLCLINCSFYFCENCGHKTMQKNPICIILLQSKDENFICPRDKMEKVLKQG